MVAPATNEMHKAIDQIKNRSNTAARELCKATLVIVTFHHDHDTRLCPSTHALHCPIHTPGSRLVAASRPLIHPTAESEPDIILPKQTH